MKLIRFLLCFASLSVFAQAPIVRGPGTTNSPSAWTNVVVAIAARQALFSTNNGNAFWRWVDGGDGITKYVKISEDDFTFSDQDDARTVIIGNESSEGISATIFKGLFSGSGSSLSNVIRGLVAGANVTLTTNAGGVITIAGVSGGATNGIPILNGNGTNTQFYTQNNGQSADMGNGFLVDALNNQVTIDWFERELIGSDNATLFTWQDPNVIQITRDLKVLNLAGVDTRIATVLSDGTFAPGDAVSGFAPKASPTFTGIATSPNFAGGGYGLSNVLRADDIRLWGASTSLTNNDVAIQAAILSTNSSVYIPPGTWQISTGLYVFTSNFRFEGAGRGISILQANTNLSIPAVITNENQAWGLLYIGPEADSDQENTSPYQTNVYVGGVSFVQTGGQDYQIHTNVTGLYSRKVVFYSAVSNLTFDAVGIYGGASEALECNGRGPVNVRIVNCDFGGNSLCAIDLNTQYARNFLISGNTISGGGAGITTVGFGHTIQHNIVYGAGNYGITAGEPNTLTIATHREGSTVIQGNVIRALGQSGKTNQTMAGILTQTSGPYTDGTQDLGMIVANNQVVDSIVSAVEQQLCVGIQVSGQAKIIGNYIAGLTGDSPGAIGIRVSYAGQSNMTARVILENNTLDRPLNGDRWKIGVFAASESSSTNLNLILSGNKIYDGSDYAFYVYPSNVTAFISLNGDVLNGTIQNLFAGWTNLNSGGAWNNKPLAGDSFGIIGPVVHLGFKNEITIQPTDALNGTSPLRVLRSGGQTILHTTGDGFVGIGTESPSYRLDVVGTMAAGENVFAGFAPAGLGNGDSIIYLTGNAVTGSAYGLNVILSATGSLLNSIVNIGAGNARQDISVAASASGDPFIQFSVEDVGPGWVVGLDNSDSDSLKITYGGGTPSSGTVALTALTGGNVGIGTTTPGANLEVAGTALIRTNIAQFDVAITDFVIGTRYTNSTRRSFVAASFQLAAAVAGTAAVTFSVEQAGVTNKLTISSGPLAGLTTIEPLSLMVGPGAFYYFADVSSGAGAVASIVAGTSSRTDL